MAAKNTLKTSKTQAGSSALNEMLKPGHSTV